jgi:hypothetical protein
MKAVQWFAAKCVCVTLGAMAGTFALNPAFSTFSRAIAGVIASGAGGLLAYLLNPTQAPPPPPPVIPDGAQIQEVGK